ncbi:peptide deformylase [Ovoidimarina sediminis]|uniref:peptide deformylase n=1 Tax=Ovoidimarina sediminis TaxID=3079856 RepID=UPI00290D599F|nr:peptide deformylase [Rhodophyticola sp. MJ-SS7]MDU8943985.1 peptide deformylase [Rhodophyticola sp. MJ-SS7]
MTVRPIVLWPDPVLAEVCAPVGAVGDDVRALAADLLETMYDAPGRGLAAPQVGVAARVFVMDISWKEGPEDPWVCIDPEIVGRSEDEMAMGEGCLSIPGVLAEVMRPEAVTLAYTALSGRRETVFLEGMLARCAQHELDHLDGIVTLDRLSEEARAEAVAAYGAGA